MNDTFKPGIYPGIPETDYHTGKFGPANSLSSTEAKTLLKAPALLAWRRTHGEPPSTAFDLGHVAHALVLGTGLPMYVHDHESLRTKAAREDVDEHRAAGEVPVSRTDWEQMRALADAVLTHPVAGPLLIGGVPEVSAYACLRDVWVRGRFDYWHEDYEDGGPLIVDLKTTGDSADPDEFITQAIRYRYELQREWYRAIAKKITGESVGFLHVVVEKRPPHLVSVVRLGADFEEIGRRHVRQALDLYRECQKNRTWPGYASDVEYVDAPDWYCRRNGLDEEW